MGNFQLPSLQVLLAFVAFMFMLLKIIRSSILAATRGKKLPPGPRTLPIVGNLHQFMGESLPHQTMAKLATKYGPIMHLKLGQVPTIVISSPEMAKQVLKTQDHIFASRPQIIAAEIILYNFSIGFLPYGETWRQIRKISVVEFLSPKRVLSFRPIREEEVSKIVEEISSNAGDPINLTVMLYKMMHEVLLRALIGKVDAQGRYARLAAEIMKALGEYFLADFFPSLKFLSILTGQISKFKNLRKQGDEFLDYVIKERLEARRKLSHTEACKDGQEDFLHVLLDMLERGEFKSTDSVKATIQDLIVAGIDTSSTTLDWAMVEMVRHPSVLAKATEEVRAVFKKQGKVEEAQLHQLKYMKLVIQETLRLHPPAPMLIPRENTETCEINGYEISARSRILVNVWAINRDPNHWTKAGAFIPERFQENDIPFEHKGTHFHYLPFGSGRRMCPGITYGLTMVQFTLASLLYNFDWKLPSGQKNEDLRVDESFGLAIRRKEDFYVIPIPYNH
uniref:Cytochrome P450 CYP71-4 n=1 Tax=Daphne genkwa TaxID=1477590 RepID=A0A977LGX9_9ROSI|nr:cytochrome P450 CYP71-4 [Daphne genkwa]